MPKVSIIIPVYNVEKYLEKCLDSLVNQTFQDIEIICVNDGSTDNSLDILKNYAKKDQRIIVINHKKNYGVGTARNIGVKISTAKYISFMDSDDYLKADMIEKAYNKILETNSDIIITSTESFTSEQDEYFQDRIKWGKVLKHKDCDNYKTDKYNFVKNYFEIPCIVGGKLFKKEFLLSNNITFIEKNIPHEDNGYWLKICLNSPIISFMSDIGVMYRLRKDSLTDKSDHSTKRSKYLNTVMKDVFNYVKKNKSKDFYKFFYNEFMNKKQYFLDMPEYKENFFKKLFIVKNEYSADKKHKVITILGIRISILCPPSSEKL